MRAQMTHAFVGIAVLASAGLSSTPAFAAGSCTVTSCTQLSAPPCGGSAPGVTNCGTPCTVNGQSMGACITICSASHLDCP